MRARTSYDAPDTLDRPPHWGDGAACQTSKDPDFWFAEGDDAVAVAERQEAKRLCGHCPSRPSCLHDALERGESIGVWGGLDADERAALTLLPTARDPVGKGWFPMPRTPVTKARPAKKARPSRKPPRPELPPTGVLDWSNPQKHWKRKAMPCRYQCGGLPTHLRDSSGSPAHKVCAELAIAQQIQEYAEAYENERLRLT